MTGIGTGNAGSSTRRRFGCREISLFEHDRGLQPRQRRAEADVRPEPERQVLAGIASPKVEDLRIVEHRGSRLAAPMATITSAPAGMVVPLKSTSCTGAAAPVDHRGVVPQDLLDGVADQGWLGAQRLPAFTHFEEATQPVPEQVGRRLVPGEEQSEQDRRHFLLGQRVPGLIGRVHEVGREVIARLGSTSLGELLAVPPEPGHALRDGHLLVVVGAAEHEAQARLGTFLDLGDVGFRYAEHVEQHERRELPRQLGDDVGPPGNAVAIQVVADDVAHDVGHRRDPARGERGLGDASRARVGRWIDVGERRNGAEASIGQRGACGRARHGHRSEGVARRERGVVAQHAATVVVPDTTQ